MADAADPGHQPIPGRQRVGHRQPRRARPGLAAHRPAGDHRGAAGRRRQRRLRRGRQGCARRLHAGDKLLVDGHRTRAAPEAALRSGARFHSGGADRHLAEHSGRFQTERLQDGGRSRRRRQGQARNADLCLGRHRLLLAHGGRTIPARRQHRRAPRAVPRRRAARSDGGTHRLLFHPVGGGRFGAPQRQADDPGREFAGARAAAAGCAFGGRGRPAECRVPLLERAVRAGQDAAGGRAKAARRDRRGAQTSRRCAKNWQNSASSRRR